MAFGREVIFEVAFMFGTNIPFTWTHRTLVGALMPTTVPASKLASEKNVVRMLFSFSASQREGKNGRLVSRRKVTVQHESQRSKRQTLTRSLTSGHVHVSG